LDFAASLPFTVTGYALVSDVPAHEVRGGSAQRVQTQFFTCVRGSCHLVVEDGRARSEVRLDAAGVGVVVPPLRWTSLYKFSDDAVLMVLSSVGDADDVREYEAFLEMVE
jgi:dTDP-4-dehydrorhamnose 3,5-epimerase-like enzyme